MSFFNRKLSQDYKEVFGSEAGKRVLKDLLTVCKHNSPTFVPGQADVTAFNEGMRRVALRIVNFVEMDHAKIMEIINKREENNE